MKKLLKKIITTLFAAAIAVTAIIIPVSAESIYDTAKAITSGKKVNTNIYSSEGCADYKVVVTKSGKLTIDIDSDIGEFDVIVYDSNSNKVPGEGICDIGYFYTVRKNKSLSFSDAAWCWRDKVNERFKGNTSYNVSKGTYYIRVRRGYGDGGSKLSLKATFPSSSSSETGKISCLSMTIGKGSVIQLGSVMSESGTVKWSSSDSSVVSVTSNGKITAKSKGTATITAKTGKNSVKIKIKVA